MADPSEYDEEHEHVPDAEVVVPTAAGKYLPLGEYILPTVMAPQILKADFAHSAKMKDMLIDAEDVDRMKKEKLSDIAMQRKAVKQKIAIEVRAPREHVAICLVGVGDAHPCAV